MGKTTALLHWCDPASVFKTVDGRAVQQGKEVRMRADWLAGYREPQLFTIREEAFFLSRLCRQLCNHWHPIGGFPVVTPIEGLSVSRDVWAAGASRITNQTHYYFTDDEGHSSGRLTVSSATHWVSKAGMTASGVDVKATPVGAELALNGHAGKVSIVHGVGASQDPGLEISLLTPYGEGDRNLTDHVRRLVAERLESWKQMDFYAKSNLADIRESELTDALLSNLSDGYLNIDARLPLGLEKDSSFVEVDEYRSAEIRIDLPAEVFDRPFRTAYAIRARDVERSANYVISDVVLLDGDGDGSIRIRG